MNRMIFDSHAHYDSEQFDTDREALLASLPSKGVRYVVNPGCNMESSRAAIRLAEAYPFLYAAVGIHPSDAVDFKPEMIPELEKMLAHPKVVAIGEIGLDYYYGKEEKEEQKRALREQLALAEKTGYKVIIHERDAWQDTVDILSEYPAVKGVFHCFSGSAECAEYLLKRDWMLSFTGVLTYKNARKPVEALKVIPLDRLMIETDSPYLSPVPHRGKRNDSENIPDTAAKMAEVKGLTTEEILRITCENAIRFFNITE